MSSDQSDPESSETSAPQAATSPASPTSAVPPPAPAQPPSQRIAIGSQRAGSRIQRAAHSPGTCAAPEAKAHARAGFLRPTEPLHEHSPALETTSAQTAPHEPVASESTATSAAVNEAPSSAAPAAATAETAAESPPAAPAQPVAKRKPAPQSTTWVTKTPVPSIRGELPPELQQEVDEALGGLSLDEVLEPGQKQQVAADLEPESRHQAKIVSIHNDDVFVELGGRNQGVLSLRQFPDATDVGQVVEVVVVRFDPEEGLYQLTLPNSAIVAANWGDITEGVIVEARVTGHNKGWPGMRSQ